MQFNVKIKEKFQSLIQRVFLQGNTLQTTKYFVLN